MGLRIFLGVDGAGRCAAAAESLNAAALGEALFRSLQVLKCVRVHLLAHEHVCMFHRQYTSDYKLETYLKVARLYLEDEDPVQAEAYINRASLLQAESTREDLLIHYKASNTRTHTWVICSLLSSADFVFPTSWFRCRRNLCMAWLLVTALLLFSVVLCICI